MHAAHTPFTYLTAHILNFFPVSCSLDKYAAVAASR